MTLVKITVETATKKYVSVDLSGHGSDDTNFSVSATSNQILPENFPAFHGTDVEWTNILDNSTKITKTNLGKPV